MKKREQAITPSVMKWSAHNIDNSLGGEVKYIMGGRYNYNSDKSLKKEIVNLKICGRVFTKKYSDEVCTGTPFDFVQLKNAPGFFYIIFHEKKKEVIVIEVSKLEKEIKSGSKSLTSGRAKEICYIVGELR